MPDAEKKQLRKLISAKRDALTPGQVQEYSAEICGRLFNFEHFQHAKTIMLFVAFRSEVQTLPIIDRALKEGKRVIVPVTVRETHELLPCEISDVETGLAPGFYGILEPPPHNRKPVDPAEIDFVCMPGLAFDLHGNRLGYGGGYYDRFVRRLRPGAILAALAFSCQIAESVPTNPTDQQVRFIITEREKICCVCHPPATPL